MTSIIDIELNKYNSTMHTGEEIPQDGHPRQRENEGVALKSVHPSVRGSFKRVFSAERPELETTVSTCNAPRTLPEQSIIESSLIVGEEPPRRVRVKDGLEEVEQKDFIPDNNEEERFSARFKKVEMSPSAILEKDKLLAKGESENLLILCVIVYEGKAAEVGCQVTAGELQFSNGCSLRLSKISKMKIAYEEYQKSLWLTYQDNTSKNHTQQLKLRLYVPGDVRDNLYSLFARILLQKLTLMNRQPDSLQCDDIHEDRFTMAGPLLKKSQFLGKWAERRMVVTDCIESFRGGKCTFAMRNIREVWTRFDLHEDCLVVKVRHGLEKTQLALPLVNYAARFCKFNWLYRIYRLVSTPLS